MLLLFYLLLPPSLIHPLGPPHKTLAPLLPPHLQVPHPGLLMVLEREHQVGQRGPPGLTPLPGLGLEQTANRENTGITKVWTPPMLKGGHW